MSSRVALVIGINTYDHMPPLKSPAADAEAIAHRLEHDSDFKVLRLPEAISRVGEEQQPQVGANLRLTQKQLRDALKQLLVPNSPQHPETVLIYFSGHGRPDPEGPLGVDKGYLLTSESNSGDDRPGISLAQVQKWLSSSPIKNQIVWLDCCHSGGLLLDVAAANPERRDGYSRCFIASSRDFEPSWTDLNTPYSTLTKALLAGLDPTRQPGQGVTTYSLVDYVTQALQHEPQTPLCDHFGQPLVLLPGLASPGTEQDRFRRQWAIPLQMPPLPEAYVERPEHETPVKASLLAGAPGGSGTLVVSALYGLGGIGKSVLATRLAHDPAVQGHFADGILWVTLGQTPDLLPLLNGWIVALGDRDYRPTTEAAASSHLRTLLYDKTMLLVVDDVWQVEHLDWFRVGGQHCRVLVTTREARIPDARIYELDPMTPDQALTLITQTLARPLGDVEKLQALSLAERLGFLPLALDLAVAQVRDGVSWDELLRDFQTELARLESLDLYSQEELPEDSKRRRHSILACFNLSLRLLSTEQLGQFAWLGIVPEDSQITPPVAALLWQVTPRQAAAILRTLRAKALLLTGVSQPGQPPTYRLHDLMHDRAQQLLTSPTQVTRQGDLPGLGLSLAQAHRHLLDRYRCQTQHHQWHTLPDDGYSYTYLTWHMEQADQPEQVHQLLQETNPTGGNGWYGACEARGKPATFVNDLGRAWRLAEQTYQQAPATALALLFRYALIRTSINSLASNIPPPLLAALVEKQIWQPAQGLAYAEQTQEPNQRADCLVALVPHLPESLLPELLNTIGQFHNATNRSSALVALAQRFPQYWPDALSAITGIQGSRDIVSKLGQVVDHLPQALLPQALEIARQIQDKVGRALALGKLAPHLPPELLPEALAAARQIQDEYYRADALGDLAPYLLPELLPEALEITRQIQDEYYRADALGDLAPYLLPELLPEALEITRQIQSESSRARALTDLAPHLPPELLPEALEATRQIQDELPRAWTLRDLAQQVPELLPEALEGVRQIQREYDRAEALGNLAPHLPPELLPEALEVSRQIQNEWHRAGALGGLAPHLPPELLPEALEITRQIQDESDRAQALGKLVQQLPELLPEALAAARQIQDEYFRAEALRDLARQFPELLPKALEATRQIQDKDSRAEALGKLAPHLPPELLPEALEIAGQIQNEYDRALALKDLAQQFPELLPEALEITRQIQNEYYRADALGNLAPYLPPELLPEALEIARQIQSEYYRADALGDLAPYLLPELLPEALEITRQIQDESDRARALTDLAPHLPPELLPEALEIARQIQSEYYRADALGDLARQLPELLPEALEITRKIQSESSRALRDLARQLPKLLPEALETTRKIQSESSRALGNLASQHFPELLPEALEITRQIQSESSRANALGELASHLPPELLPEALEIARQIQSHYRALALGKLAPHLSPELLPEALEATRQIQSEYYRADALGKLAQHFPELLPEALEITRQIQIEQHRALALGKLAQHFPELLPEALEITRQIQSESSRANALGELASHLPPELLPEALEIMETFKERYYAAEAWFSLLPRLEELQVSFLSFAAILDTLAYQERSELIQNFPTMQNTLTRLGGETTLDRCLQAMAEVCNQWR